MSTTRDPEHSTASGDPTAGVETDAAGMGEARGGSGAAGATGARHP